MSTLGTVLAAPRRDRRSDPDLVAACLSGDEHAWAQLIDRYKRLIFSVPLKRGIPREEAADLFQAVCLDLVTELPRLRDPQALPQWLIQTAMHKTTKWIRRNERVDPDGIGDIPAGPEHIPEAQLRSLEREQAVRAALDSLPSRCRQMFDMLFFDSPPRSYRDVALKLGLAPGSIGFIRFRCLQRLRAELQKAGL
jgi:RNA polymerase sigma factor (sigma-70 family)